jgi:signal transduction histidine kinase
VANTESNESLPDALDRLRAEVAELRESRKRVAGAADADRRDLERLLHAGVQQDLVALTVGLQRLAELVERDPAAARQLLAELASDARAATEAAAELARRIYPPLLDAGGLAVALRSAAVAAGVTLELQQTAGARVPPEVAAAVYWSSVDAFASAPPGSHARIRLNAAAGSATFEIELEGPLSADHLRRLRDRVEALEGQIVVEALPDGGTRIQGRLPTSGSS